MLVGLFGIFDLNKELESNLKDNYGEEEGGVSFPLEEVCLFLTSQIRSDIMQSRKKSVKTGGIRVDEQVHRPVRKRCEIQFI